MKRGIFILALALAAVLTGCADNESSSEKKKESKADSVVSSKTESSESVQETEAQKEQDSKPETEAESKQDSDTDSGTDSEESQTDENDEKLYDTGLLSVLQPKGWLAFSASDTDGNEDPSSVYLIKNGKEQTDFLYHPYLWITRYTDGRSWFSSKSFYDDAKDIDPVTIGERNWEGFTFTSLDVPGMTIYTEDEKGQWVCNMILENSGESISVDDDDVRKIIESISDD